MCFPFATEIINKMYRRGQTELIHDADVNVRTVFVITDLNVYMPKDKLTAPTTVLGFTYRVIILFRLLH